MSSEVFSNSILALNWTFYNNRSSFIFYAARRDCTSRTEILFITVKVSLSLCDSRLAAFKKPLTFQKFNTIPISYEFYDECDFFRSLCTSTKRILDSKLNSHMGREKVLNPDVNHNLGTKISTRFFLREKKHGYISPKFNTNWVCMEAHSSRNHQRRCDGDVIAPGT